MATEVRLPELGEGIESGDVVGVLVAEGDSVELQQPLVELETDKATVEVPAEVAGTITKVHVSNGDTVAVGAVLVTVDDGGSRPEKEGPADSPPSPAQEAPPAAATPPPTPEATPREAVPAAGEIVSFPPAAAKPASAPGTPVPAAPSVRRFAREIGIDIHQVGGSGPGRADID